MDQITSCDNFFCLIKNEYGRLINKTYLFIKKK